MGAVGRHVRRAGCYDIRCTEIDSPSNHQSGQEEGNRHVTFTSHLCAVIPLALTWRTCNLTAAVTFIWPGHETDLQLFFQRSRPCIAQRRSLRQLVIRRLLSVRTCRWASSLSGSPQRPDAARSQRFPSEQAPRSSADGSPSAACTLPGPARHAST